MNTNDLKAAATGRALAKPKPTTIHGFLETYKNEIARALPKHLNADRMARVALTECRKTPALLRCKPESLFGAIIQASQLGLEPGGAMGHCYLIPFGQEVQFIVGYRGMIDLARRSGQIVSLEAHAVYDGDQFDCVFGLASDLKHVPDWQNPNRANPDKLRFVYAVAKLKDGGVQFEVMSRAEVDSIRTRSKAAKSGPWVTDYAAMALKTVIRRLFKYLPVSIELQQAIGLDEQADANISQGNEHIITGEVIAQDEPEFNQQDDVPPPPSDHQDEALRQLEQLQSGAIPAATGKQPEKAAAGDWQPTPEEEAAIRERELAEAGQQQPTTTRARRERSGQPIE